MENKYMIIENQKIVEFLTGILKRLKAEKEKRNELYKHGVDLTNYENEYNNCCLELIKFLVGGDKDDFIPWWMYEKVEKKVWGKDGTEHDLTKAEELVKYVLNQNEIEEPMPSANSKNLQEKAMKIVIDKLASKTGFPPFLLGLNKKENL